MVKVTTAPLRILGNVVRNSEKDKLNYMKELSNKWPIIIGVIFAGLNLIMPGYSAILCIINNTRDFCGEAWAGVLINTPTFQILAWPFILEELDNMFFVILLISGVIQYFLVGYMLAKLILFFARKINMLFPHSL